MCGGVGACSQVKLNRMGQAVLTAIRVERALLAQLVLSLKCLELAQKVELGVNVFFLLLLKLLVRSVSLLKSC